MRKRNVALAGVGIVVVVLALVGGFGRSSTGGAEQASSSPPEAGSTQHAAAARTAEKPLSARASASPTADVPALQARDQRRRDAVAPFGASLLAALDGCFTAGPGPRVPQRLLLRFERAAAATPGHETFKLKNIAPLDVPPGQPQLRDTQVGTCLSALAGRTLDVPSGAGSQESSFDEIIALPIPASLAWAPPQLPLR